MAATDTPATARAASILAAALALPGVAVHAENAPERAELSVRMLDYQDAQPGLQRIHVRAPSIYALVPLGEHWAVEGSAVSDSVSGATPRYHSAISGATRRMSDERHAGDVKLTRYTDRASWSLGAAVSDEHDYQGRSVSFGASLASDDNNRTWNFGLGLSRDRIGSTNDASLHERRRTTEWMVGVTQALTAVDLVQVNLSFNQGRGHFSDPYKEPDIRPRQRDQSIVLLRWNHHVEGIGATARTSYRYYRDTFGIRAHTLGLEWVQPLGARWSVTPLLRLYSQSAAHFYFDPVYDPDIGAPYPPGYFTNPPKFVSPDQRLSAFGAVTFGLKVAWQITPDWLVDVKAERYEQRGNWRIGGTGSPGLEPFRARFVQVGVSHRF